MLLMVEMCWQWCGCAEAAGWPLLRAEGGGGVAELLFVLGDAIIAPSSATTTYPTYPSTRSSAGLQCRDTHRAVCPITTHLLERALQSVQY